MQCERISKLWRDLADSILDRERELQKLHDFSLLDSDAGRFWIPLDQFNPLSNASVRQDIDNMLQNLTKKFAIH